MSSEKIVKISATPQGIVKLSFQEEGDEKWDIYEFPFHEDYTKFGLTVVKEGGGEPASKIFAGLRQCSKIYWNDVTYSVQGVEESYAPDIGQVASTEAAVGNFLSKQRGPIVVACYGATKVDHGAADPVLKNAELELNLKISGAYRRDSVTVDNATEILKELHDDLLGLSTEDTSIEMEFLPVPEEGDQLFEFYRKCRETSSRWLCDRTSSEIVFDGEANEPLQMHLGGSFLVLLPLRFAAATITESDDGDTEAFLCADKEWDNYEVLTHTDYGERLKLKLKADAWLRATFQSEAFVAPVFHFEHKIKGQGNRAMRKAVLLSQLAWRRLFLSACQKKEDKEYSEILAEANQLCKDILIWFACLEGNIFRIGALRGQYGGNPQIIDLTGNNQTGSIATYASFKYKMTQAIDVHKNGKLAMELMYALSLHLPSYVAKLAKLFDEKRLTSVEEAQDFKGAQPGSKRKLDSKKDGVAPAAAAAGAGAAPGQSSANKKKKQDKNKSGGPKDDNHGAGAGAAPGQNSAHKKKKQDENKLGSPEDEKHSRDGPTGMRKRACAMELLEGAVSNIKSLWAVPNDAYFEESTPFDGDKMYSGDWVGNEKMALRGSSVIIKTFSGADELEDYLREVEILKTIKGVPYTQKPIMSTEARDKNFAVIVSPTQPSTAWQVKSIEDLRVVGCQVLEGLIELHKLGILHRDVKPDNILWCPVRKQVTLIDFGLATKATVSRVSPRGVTKFHYVISSHGYVGTEGYQAPEVLAGCHYDGKVDVFSLGKTLNSIASAAAIGNDSSLKQAVDNMTKWDQSERCTATEALQLAFFSNVQT